MSAKKDLLERLAAGPVLCAEGYVFELERRGYIQAGPYVPEVVLENPEVVTQLHREFVRAGSDVTLALTYYAHREKLKVVGRENDLEAMNRAALSLAADVAKDTGTLLAGGICNTGAYDPADKAASEKEVRRQYEEQIGWAADAEVDFMFGETIEYVGEALLALEVIKKHNLVAVINLATNLGKSKDGVGWVDACKMLKDKGADVVGFNCSRGPEAMLPLLKQLRAEVKGPIAAIPVPYRTTPDKPSFQSLRNSNGHNAYTTGLDEFLCTRQEMADFTVTARDMGVNMIGICCGAGPHHVRAMAEALGRTVPASRFSPDMSKHYLLGKEGVAKKHEKEFLEHFEGR